MICERVASQLQKCYQCLNPRYISQGKEALANQIYNHCRHLSKLKNKRKSSGGSLDGATFHSFNKRQNCGVEQERDLPSELPDGETKDSQEKTRLSLKEIHASGCYNGKEVKRLMALTYVTQRAAINKKLRMDQLLEQWPFFGNVSSFALINCTVHSIVKYINLVYLYLDK